KARGGAGISPSRRVRLDATARSWSSSIGLAVSCTAGGRPSPLMSTGEEHARKPAKLCERTVNHLSSSDTSLPHPSSIRQDDYLVRAPDPGSGNPPVAARNPPLAAPVEIQ